MRSCSAANSRTQHLSGYIEDGELLLVLDNFEQVLPVNVNSLLQWRRLPADEFVSELLAVCSRLRVLVTSRSPLHLSVVQEFTVPPLPVPRAGSAVSAASVAAADSVQLFAIRAAASVPGFTIDDRNAKPIAGIVQRLDGLPLAIELAAARVKLLPPEEIQARLDHSLGLLVGAVRDVPDRQRTLRATIAWSYDLLSDGARRLLAAMSVFRGGAALDGIEAVCREVLHLDLSVLDALQELVDHSLVRLAPSATIPRYAMLERSARGTHQRPAPREHAKGYQKNSAGALAFFILFHDKTHGRLRHSMGRAQLAHRVRVDPGVNQGPVWRHERLWGRRCRWRSPLPRWFLPRRVREHSCRWWEGWLYACENSAPARWLAPRLAVSGESRGPLRVDRRS